jgi:glycosyl-4,4'-diaponeurosporenoate acyltransferase
VRIELPIVWVIVLNVAGWPVIQFVLAWVFTRLPVSWFDPPKAPAWEAGGRVYERWLQIKRWKDHLPDASKRFGGGFAKGELMGIDFHYLERFIRETWRGELCHWVALAFAPVFFLWNPWWADVVMVSYALAANLPCIAAQRYNRGRLQRLLDRRA